MSEQPQLEPGTSNEVILRNIIALVASGVKLRAAARQARRYAEANPE